jgi:hypothetical protein
MEPHVKLDITNIAMECAEHRLKYRLLRLLRLATLRGKHLDSWGASLGKDELSVYLERVAKYCSKDRSQIHYWPRRSIGRDARALLDQSLVRFEPHLILFRCLKIGQLLIRAARWMKRSSITYCLRYT